MPVLLPTEMLAVVTANIWVQMVGSSYNQQNSDTLAVTTANLKKIKKVGGSYCQPMLAVTTANCFYFLEVGSIYCQPS